MIEEYEKMQLEFAESQEAHYRDMANDAEYLKWIEKKGLPNNFDSFSEFVTSGVESWEDFSEIGPETGSGE